MRPPASFAASSPRPDRVVRSTGHRGEYREPWSLARRHGCTERYCKRIFPARLPALWEPGVFGMATSAILSMRLYACAQQRGNTALRCPCPHIPCQQTAIEADRALRLSLRGEVVIMAVAQFNGIYTRIPNIPPEAQRLHRRCGCPG